MTLDFDTCYRAVLARDPRFDGRFFTAVTSTGIYCRPVCPARTPARRNMRFYSGDHGGRMNHHDIALCENPNLPKPPADWQMFDMPVAINHIAIMMPNREAWLKQLAWLRKKGIKFHRRVNHGMTHSLYISDPNGYGVEVLYELPREVWGDNIQGALDYAEPVATEGDDAFVDDTDYPRFAK